MVTLGHVGGASGHAFLYGTLVAVVWIYIRGVTTQWRRAGKASIPPWRMGSFLAGTLALALAVTGPLPGAADRLFSLHMVQHQVLMMVVAPLMVLGRPGTAMVWALPRDRRAVAVHWRHRLGIDLFAATPSGPILLVVALWAWHLPVLYEAAVGAGWLHGLEHITMFGGAVAFWTSLGARRLSRMGGSLLAIFLVGVATSALSALLLFAAAPLYPAYAALAAAGGFDALEDQRFAALVMWIPSGLVGLAAAIAIVVREIGEVPGHRAAVGVGGDA